MNRYSILLGGLLMAGVLPAADLGPHMSSPVLGYVFDESAKSIRAIAGVPGAASLGESVDVPVALTKARVHAGARLALASTKEGQIALIAWGDVVRMSPIETSLGDVTLVAFSRSGGRVALSDGVSLEVWSTSGTPALVSRRNPDAEITTIAVNDESSVAAATSAGRVVRFAADGAQSISTGGDWTAVEFSNDGRDILAADATRNELVLLSADGGRVAVAVLPEAANGIAVSADGENFAVALVSGLAVISSSGAVATVACNCEPKALDRLQGDLVVHVRGTALVLDADGLAPRLTTLPNLFALNAGGSN